MFDTFCNIIPHNGNQVVVKCEFLSYVGISYFNFSYYTTIIKLDTREKKTSFNYELYYISLLFNERITMELLFFLSPYRYVIILNATRM